MASVRVFTSLWNLTKLSFDLFVRLEKLIKLVYHSELAIHAADQRDVGSVCSCVLEEWLWREDKGLFLIWLLSKISLWVLQSYHLQI